MSSGRPGMSGTTDRPWRDDDKYMKCNLDALASRLFKTTTVPRSNLFFQSGSV